MFDLFSIGMRNNRSKFAISVFYLNDNKRRCLDISIERNQKEIIKRLIWSLQINPPDVSYCLKKYNH